MGAMLTTSLASRKLSTVRFHRKYTATFNSLTIQRISSNFFFFFNDPPPPETYPLPLPDALPISARAGRRASGVESQRHEAAGDAITVGRPPTRGWARRQPRRDQGRHRRQGPLHRRRVEWAGRREIGRAHV